MYIKVKVVAGAKKENWKKVSQDSFSASVREPAKHERANRRVRELIADHFHLSTTTVRLVAGHHHPRKIFSLPD